MTSTRVWTILLADDDEDDCFLFQEALQEITLPTRLTTVRDGEQLMHALSKSETPDVLFLDLNMPRKDGLQCLIEIRQQEKYKKLPVIIFSTSNQPDAVDKLHQAGAQYYIRKPSNFEHYRKVISQAMVRIAEHVTTNPSSRDYFVVEP